MKEHRTTIPLEVEAKLQEYFGDTRLSAGIVKCVVTEATPTWHHLNHNHNDHRLSNIVPLEQELNTNLYYAQRDRSRLDPRLECPELKIAAERAFLLDGQVARAYGCARIECYVAEYCNKPLSCKLECAGRALYYARQRLSYEIIGELLHDTILVPLQRSGDAICPEVIRGLLQEFETLLTYGGENLLAQTLRLEAPTTAYADPTREAGALRRSAHTLGRNHGPTSEVLSRLKESMTVYPPNPNQELNVANSTIDVQIGERTKDGYKRAMDAASEPYRRLFAKINVHDGRVWPKSNSQTQPVLATPANVAVLCLMEPLLFVLTGGSRKQLPQRICVAEHYWGIAGTKLDGPGQGTWQAVIDSLDNTDPYQCKLARMIRGSEAPALPSSIKRQILDAAKTLVERLHTASL